MSVRADVPYQDHVKRLLDQRTARANLHGRFPSVSEFSDSPSIYSHAHFSPMPLERVDDGAYASTSHHRQPSEPCSPMSDRQRLNIPTASSLDLDDDVQSLSASSHVPDDDESASAEDETLEEDAETHRVSAYGPKMTVHSRAPWEAGEDENDDPAEQDVSGKRGAFKFSKGDKSKKSKGLTRNAVQPRPSIDSVRSQSKSKQSFDTVSSNVSTGGALLALAQASMSSTSLALSQVPSPQTSLRDKLALPRFRSRTPSNTNSKADSADGRRPSLPSQSPYSSPSPNYRALSPTNGEYYHSADSRPSYTEPSSPQTPLHPQDFHPYANPDLVRALPRDLSPSRRLEELHALAQSAPHSPVVLPHTDSTATITESSTSTTISTASNSRSETANSITPGTSLSSVVSQNGFSPTSRAFAKGISGPLPLEGSSQMVVPMRSSNDSEVSSAPAGKWDPPFTPTGFAGWQENTSAPIKLISLQEAQAQARERSRSATASGTPISAPADPATSRQAQSAPGFGGRSRMRTTSAGAKAKKLTSASAVDLHAQVDGLGEGSMPHTAPPLKTVSRKRSGFMRLFNARDKAQSPPPVPSLSMDAIASPPVMMSVRTRKQSTHRVPVPSITPSLMADIDSQPSSGSLESRSISEGVIPPMPALHHNSASQLAARQLSLRRNAPGLSIMPPSPPETTVRVVDGSLTPTSGAVDVPPFSASTDPRSSEFVTLSLRPVSTTFSADFAGQIHNGSRHSSDTDPGTPTSTTAISPQSPGFPLPTDKKGDKLDAVAQEDQSAVIQALQEQVLAARRAWQREVWELEGQVRDLKAEVEDLRAANSAREYCPACGRGSVSKHAEDDSHLEELRKADVKVTSVVNRPRARTGVGSRFASRT